MPWEVVVLLGAIAQTCLVVPFQVVLALLTLIPWSVYWAAWGIVLEIFAPVPEAILELDIFLA